MSKEKQDQKLKYKDVANCHDKNHLKKKRRGWKSWIPRFHKRKKNKETPKENIIELETTK